MHLTTQCLRFLDLLKSEHESYVKFFSLISAKQSAMEEKNKEAATQADAALMKMASDWVNGAVQEGCDSGTMNQNLIRNGVGRFHIMSKADWADKIPGLLQAMLRRMASEESLAIDSIAPVI